MKFIDFEGLDGAGKSTLIQRVGEHLNKLGVSYIQTREPGGTRLGEDLRQLLLRTDQDPPVSECEILMYQASRAQHVKKVIFPALQNKQWVLTDRFSPSTVAFQCYGRNIPREEVEWLNRYATGGLYPDLIVLIDIDVEESQRRQNQSRKWKDRLESEKMTFHEKVRQGFLDMAQTAPDQWLVLDGNDTVENNVDRVMALFQEKKWLL